MSVKKGKSFRGVVWFGMRLSATGAQILYIISILGVIGCAISLLFMMVGIFQVLGYSALLTEYGYGYLGLGLSYYIVYIVVIIAFLIFFLYNIRLIQKSR